MKPSSGSGSTIEARLTEHGEAVNVFHDFLSCSQGLPQTSPLLLDEVKSKALGA